MERGSFRIKKTNGREGNYKRICEVGYWGRRYIYKRFETGQIPDKDKTSKMRYNAAKEEIYAPYMGIYKKEK